MEKTATLKQITMTGGIPFPVTLSNAPNNINADIMTTTHIRNLLDEGLDDIESGRVVSARDAFARSRERQRA